MMSIVDVRTKTDDQLKQELIELRKEQLNLRFQKSTGQLENTSLIRSARQKIARIKTVLVERKKGIEVVAKEAKKAPATKKKTEAKKPAAKKKAPAKKAEKKKA